jgi:RNA polymerase sigma-70 factor (ECF subfamily)
MGSVDSRDDDVLVRASQQGDRRAFETLVARHAQAILSVTSRMIGRGPDAEDVAQETFVAACRGLSRFRSDARFSTWLYGIALNKCRDVLRARKPALWLTADGDDDEQAAAAWAASGQASPDVALERTELSSELEQAIQALPPHYRESFVLRHIEGLEYDEMSAATGVARDTLKMRVYKARTLLADALGHLDVERR